MDDLKIVMMVGLPLSGKSTYIDQFKQKPASKIGPDNSYTIVCPDDVRLALGFEFHKPMENFVWATVETMARALLLRGQNIVVDATNLTRYSRKLWINLAKEYKAELQVIIIDTPVEECVGRSEDTNRWQMIPVIRRMHNGREDVTKDELKKAGSFRIIKAPVDIYG